MPRLNPDQVLPVYVATGVIVSEIYLAVLFASDTHANQRPPGGGSPSDLLAAFIMVSTMFAPAGALVGVVVYYGLKAIRHLLRK